MTVHNHGIDPTCREVRSANGALRGECMVNPLKTAGMIINTPAPTVPKVSDTDIAMFMNRVSAKQWTTINLLDRLQEALNAKVEGDNGRLPERGMLNLADVQALIDMVKSHAAG